MLKLPSNYKNHLLLGAVIASAMVLMAFEYRNFERASNTVVAKETYDEFTLEPEKIIKIESIQPKKPAAVIKPKSKEDILVTKKITETKKAEEIDTVLLAINIEDIEEVEDGVELDTVPIINKPKEPYLPMQVNVPFYDANKNLSEEAKLHALSTDLHAHLTNNLNVSYDEVQLNKSDKMFVRFVINESGHLINIEVAKPELFNPIIIQKVTTVLEKTKAFNPATKNGEPVSVFYNIPLNFNP